MELRGTKMVPVLLLQLLVYVKAQEVEVTVQQGTLRGIVLQSAYNTSYTAFRGIPYAQPPVGELRFADPKPAGGWEGVRDASEYGSDCIQPDGRGSEDCLYLNVYVPGKPEEGAKLPVMFWVHGGGYVYNSGSDTEHGPDFLISYGVILVTINYRLAQLGFLTTGDEVVPGNAGLKDQNLALKWAKQNIASFGGDPDQITLWGQSAGGGSVSLHLVSPLSTDLFSRIIIQSGNFIGMSGSPALARQNAFNLGAVLGFETDDSQELVDFLRSLNATDLLVDGSLVMTDEQKQMYSAGVWSPQIEPDLEGALVPEQPIQRLIDGRFLQIPIFTGVTSGEMGAGILSNPGQIKTLNERFVEALGPNMHLPTVEQQQEAAAKLRKFYFGDGVISTDDPEALVNFSNDMSMFASTDALVRKVTEITDLPVFYYEFDYHVESVPDSEWGAPHSSDLPFLFLRKDTVYNLDPDSDEDKARRNLLRLYTNFAKYGNPTPEADPVVWEPYNNSTRSFMLMQATFSLSHDKDKERMDFWEENVPLLPYADPYSKHNL